MADFTWEQNRADAAGAGRDAVDDRTAARCRWSARIHGDCYAGGVGLAAVCDVLRRRRGRHLLPERSAPRPAAGDDQPVRRARDGRAGGAALLRHRRALRRRRGAGVGFVHEVCAADAIDATVDEIVAALVANGPMATRACKQLVQDVAGREITRRAARRDRAPHRRHPRQRRRPRRHPELPRQAQAGVA